MDNTDTIADAYFVPDARCHPADLAAKVLTFPEHRHLVENDIDIDWLMRRDEKIKGGRRVLGSVHEPMVQGELRPLFEWLLDKTLGRLPQFLIILDADYWNAASMRDREILVAHELAHIQQKLDRFGSPRFDRDGNPVYGLIGHDVEEFTSIVARYGAHSEEIQNFIYAATSADN